MNQRAYFGELMSIIASLPENKRPEFLSTFTEGEKNPVVAFGFNAFLGYFGADRFYIGNILQGILKLVTLGGCGIWVLVDYFMIAGAAREKNIVAARHLKESMR